MTKTEARKLAKACRAAVDLHTVGHAMAGVPRIWGKNYQVGRK